jgi:hypothetical protein
VFGDVNANDFGAVDIQGSDFELNGTPVVPGPISFPTGTRPRLTGKLKSDEMIDNDRFLGTATASLILISGPPAVCNDGIDDDGDD